MLYRTVLSVEIYVRQVVAEQIAVVLETLQLGTEHSDELLTLLDVLIQFCSDSDQKVSLLHSLPVAMLHSFFGLPVICTFSC